MLLLLTMRLRRMLCFFLAAQTFSEVLAFSVCRSSSSTSLRRSSHPSPWRRSRSGPVLLPRVPLRLRGSNSDEDEEREGMKDPGMAEAFRQLESLESLEDDNDGPVSSSSSSRRGIKVPVNDVDLQVDPSIEAATPEQEVQLYQDMVRDLEDRTEDDLYSDVLSDLGGSSSLSAPSTSRSTMTATDSNEAFFNQALEEALEDVKLNNPGLSDSILDDKEMMKEIEAIFERGNEKLMDSLEEIRQEQRELARVSANKNALEAAEVLHADARRLEQAEASMQVMLNRVNKETGEVNKAVQQLEAVQAQLDNDILVKLKKGGLVKQLSFVGLMLFSVRSIVDTVIALNDPSHGMSVALIQGIIALACALVFFFS